MKKEMIQVFKPDLGQEELDALSEIFKTGWIGLGPKTEEFEQKFAEFVGAKYAVALNSATAALHLACLSLGIGPEDEVLIPTMSFVSTAHAPVYCGAKPVFVDCEPDTLCIDVDDMKRKITAKTKAVIPVHYGGHACDMDAIWALANQNGFFVIEDASHACGSTYKNENIGGLEQSKMSCFSFHAVKNLATGDGGMITTNSFELVHLLKRLRWVGIDKSTWDRTEDVTMEMQTKIRNYSTYGWYYEVNDLGYKYHMNDITATIGLVQLQKLEKANEQRRKVVTIYQNSFKDVKWLERPIEKEYTHSAWHNYVIKTPYRDKLNLHMKELGIATGVHYMPIHLQPYYRNKTFVSLPKAEKVWTTLLTLPLYPNLSDVEVNRVIEAVLSLPI